MVSDQKKWVSQVSPLETWEGCRTVELQTGSDKLGPTKLRTNSDRPL